MAIDRTATDPVLARAIAEASRDAAESRPDDDYLAGIRRLFLEPRATYGLEEIASLWRMTVDDVRDVFHDELTATTDLASAQIAFVDVLSATTTFSIVRAIDVERALDVAFSAVRPEFWRTVSVVVHVPRFIADALTMENAGKPHALAAAIERLLTDCFHDSARPRRRSADA